MICWAEILYAAYSTDISVHVENMSVEKSLNVDIC